MESQRESEAENTLAEFVKYLDSRYNIHAGSVKGAQR